MNDCCRYNDAVGGGTSDDPDHSDSYMSNSTLDEHGSVTTTTSNLKAWVMGNDGTWVQSSQTIGYSGSGGKGSTYTFNDDDQTHDVETQVFPDSSVLVNKDNNDVSNSHATTVTESYSYNNGITITNTGPTTWGGGTATRTTTSQDGSVQSGNWEVDAPGSPTVAGTSSSNSNSNTTKKYTEAWGPDSISTRLELDSTTNTHTKATTTIGGVPVTGSPSVTDTPSSDHETITGNQGLDFTYGSTANAATFAGGKAIAGKWTRALVTVNSDGTETYTPAQAEPGNEEPPEGDADEVDDTIEVVIEFFTGPRGITEEERERMEADWQAENAALNEEQRDLHLEQLAPNPLMSTPQDVAWMNSFAASLASRPLSAAAEDARSEDELSGLTLYRKGQLPEFDGDPDATFLKGSRGTWSLENPLNNENFASEYGLPAANSGAPDWIAGAHANVGVGLVGFGPAEAFEGNPGGANEFTVSPHEVTIEWFHMP